MKNILKRCCLLFVLSFALLVMAFVNTPPDKLPLIFNADASITYVPDADGNTIPDFSRVGYHQGDKAIPDVPVVKTISAAENGDSEKIIQDAIDEVSGLKPDKNGFRGAVLLKKGTYNIAGALVIKVSGVVIRGEGNTEQGTKLVATGQDKRSLITIIGEGAAEEQQNSKVSIADNFVPFGSKSFRVTSGKGFKAGDQIIIYRPGTENWIADLKMDKIPQRVDTLPIPQWKANEYDLKFERNITEVQGNTIFIDNPIVMEMDKKYGGGEVYKYSYKGRIKETGIENIYFESVYKSEKDEDHSWKAIEIDKAENCWVSSVTAKYFAFGCVLIKKDAKYVTVQNSKCYDAKSIIVGGRRYSFYVNGQLNLVMNCDSRDARHDYATGQRVCGPNVFYNCNAIKEHADIGPHQRWAVGTLYDNIITDGVIAVQDRSSLGPGQGWAGVTQVLWNCTAKKAAVQNPWVSGKNYCFGLTGQKWVGEFPGRPDGEWYSQNSSVVPRSLYMAQLNARKTPKK